VRYVVNGTWPGAIAPALTPARPTTPTATFWGWARITGQPGTQPIPSPAPGVHSISPSPVNQPSHTSPDLIYPALYRTDPDIRWRHTPVRPDEIMPVPAGNLFNMPGVAMVARRVGGRHQVAQPGVVQSWPDLLGRLTSGIQRRGTT
jgi:hypothetical protein